MEELQVTLFMLGFILLVLLSILGVLWLIEKKDRESQERVMNSDMGKLVDKLQEENENLKNKIAIKDAHIRHLLEKEVKNK